MVTLPKGFTHKIDHGIDSDVGHFTSPDGRLMVEYDIGAMAGVYTSQPNNWDTVLSTNVLVNNLTALIVVARWSNTNHIIVSFPKGGPANFFADIRDEADYETVKRLALTFTLKPEGQNK